MITGIISDTHDNMMTLKKAVDYFNDRNVLHVIHAGDFTSPFTFRVLKGLRSASLASSAIMTATGSCCKNILTEGSITSRIS